MSSPYQPTRWLVPAGYVNSDPNIFPFLRGQVFTASKGPDFSAGTTVKKAKTGRQVRASRQSAPIWTFKVAYEFLSARSPGAGVIGPQELQSLWAFYMTRRGQFGSFFYLDPWDSAVVDQQVGVGDGVTQSFQLTRTVAPGTPYAFVEPVYGVAAPTFTVGGSVVSGATVQEGVVTFAQAPAAGAPIVWSGTFLFWCHFTQDQLTPQQLVASLWSLDDGLTFESLLP